MYPVPVSLPEDRALLHVSVDLTFELQALNGSNFSVRWPFGSGPGATLALLWHETVSCIDSLPYDVVSDRQRPLSFELWPDGQSHSYEGLLVPRTPMPVDSSACQLRRSRFSVRRNVHRSVGRDFDRFNRSDTIRTVRFIVPVTNQRTKEPKVKSKPEHKNRRGTRVQVLEYGEKR